jgi:hypothetical protein
MRMASMAGAASRDLGRLNITDLVIFVGGQPATIVIYPAA